MCGASVAAIDVLETLEVAGTPLQEGDADVKRAAYVRAVLSSESPGEGGPTGAAHA